MGLHCYEGAGGNAGLLPGEAAVVRGGGGVGGRAAKACKRDARRFCNKVQAKKDLGATLACLRSPRPPPQAHPHARTHARTLVLPPDASEQHQR